MKIIPNKRSKRCREGGMGREAPKNKAKIANTRAAAAALVGWNSGFGGGRKDVVFNRFHVEELRSWWNQLTMKALKSSARKVRREQKNTERWFHLSSTFILMLNNTTHNTESGMAHRSISEALQLAQMRVQRLKAFFASPLIFHVRERWVS